MCNHEKTILITGSTDGIGLAAAKKLTLAGRHILLHGRNAAKLEDAQKELSALSNSGPVESYRSDLSHMDEVGALAKAVAKKHSP